MTFGRVAILIFMPYTEYIKKKSWVKKMKLQIAVIDDVQRDIDTVKDRKNTYGQHGSLTADTYCTMVYFSYNVVDNKTYVRKCTASTKSCHAQNVRKTISYSPQLYGGNDNFKT